MDNKNHIKELIKTNYDELVDYLESNLDELLKNYDIEVESITDEIITIKNDYGSYQLTYSINENNYFELIFVNAMDYLFSIDSNLYNEFLDEYGDDEEKMQDEAQFALYSEHFGLGFEFDFENKKIFDKYSY